MKAAFLLALVCCASCASASRLFLTREEFLGEQPGRGLKASAAAQSFGGEFLARPAARFIAECSTTPGLHTGRDASLQEADRPTAAESCLQATAPMAKASAATALTASLSAAMACTAGSGVCPALVRAAA